MSKRNTILSSGDKVDYIICKTQYTSRLSKIMKKMDKSLIKNELEYETLFINDKLWGNGVYYKNDDTEEADNVLKVIKDDGIIVFKNNGEFSIGHLKELTDLLHAINYCEFMIFESLLSIETINKNKKVYMILNYDTESG